MWQRKVKGIGQVSFKRYRNTTLVKHLGNLLGATRIQTRHLNETRRIRKPLELPHSRYRTRVYSRGMMDTEFSHHHQTSQGFFQTKLHRYSEEHHYGVFDLDLKEHHSKEST